MTAQNSRVLVSLVLGMAIGLLALIGAVLGGSADEDRASDQGTPRFADTADFVRAAALDRRGSDSVAIVVVIEPGFHINANPASMDNLIPTTLNMETPAPLHVTYPKAVRFKPKFSDDVLDVYEGTVTIIAQFAPGELARRERLVGTVTAQACTDEICLPPADLDLPER